MLILVPIFLPFVDKLGINQIHFGILCIACLGIGIFLPPIGMGMFIACNFAQIDVGKMFRSFAPYLLVFLIGLFIITCVPWFTPRSSENIFPGAMRDCRKEKGSACPDREGGPDAAVLRKGPQKPSTARTLWRPARRIRPCTTRTQNIPGISTNPPPGRYSWRWN